jgi:predicted GNAT superfamily acetyltransferase
VNWAETLIREEGGLTLRPFTSTEEYEACVDFQEETWGRGFSEKVPSAVLMIANRLGGLAAGAFDGKGELQGFVFGLTGLVDGELVHWSDMLAVRDGARDLGLGTRLKEYQREILLNRGIREMLWTFDPLQGRNAHVNFSKLGILSSEYVENMYGLTGSPLHQGVGTDRLVASWSMASERVASRLSGKNPPPLRTGHAGVRAVVSVRERAPSGRRPSVESLAEEFPSPGEVVLGLNDSLLSLPIPADIEEVMRAQLPLAIRWRETTREAFLHYLSRGYVIREFLRGPVISSYLLALPDKDPEPDQAKRNQE